ncbi:MAG: tyrosine-type recombinase/integrase [Actinomycetota bacterium]|nr:tyrosine-type recombinase/integrase [Actinomycetota bacterium]
MRSHARWRTLCGSTSTPPGLPTPTAWCSPPRAGAPLDYSHWRHRLWVSAAAAAGVPGAGFHDLRRANATALVAAGVDIKTAQSRLGHSDPRLTLAVYARAVPEAD